MNRWWHDDPSEVERLGPVGWWILTATALVFALTLLLAVFP